MQALLIQAGQRLVVDCPSPSLSRLLSEGGAGAWRPSGTDTADVRVEVQSHNRPFDVRGWAPLCRGGYARDDAVVLSNACGSGFDLRLTVAARRLLVEARWSPPARERLAARLLRSRFHLLARAALLQYPALWWAGCRGRVPVHAGAVTLGTAVPLLAGPGGVGRSTLVLGAVTAGERACSDNLCVTDGVDVHGLVEPMRLQGGRGRHMSYGRTERPLLGRVDALRPDRLVVLRKAVAGRPTVRPLEPGQAARSLVTATYLAGELRRYWPFAAALALGTGRGPAHPPVESVALRLVRRLPAVELTLGDRPEEGLAALYRLASETLERAEATP
ncbi:hypothetical protein [Streptomyces sp. S.PB5]|uniref:hypothetical protein n=1 Tax=Streptomyces sp. S.PB5 TaxID=3020844 RepID=UPI0025AFA8DC|nr:hypothetical protein [Streptomyces sp. S.PB5]MDN3025501.1 hypothetical protein [Streptomyces sp. S.PB5]